MIQTKQYRTITLMQFKGQDELGVHRLPFGRFRIAAWVMLIAAFSACALAQSQIPLTQLEFDIVGIRLVVDPPALTVPKNIATQINTQLVLPNGSGFDAGDALATFTAETVVEAELRGPSLLPTKIVTKPGQPVPIPPLALPGDYFLDRIRLVKNGQVILNATPFTVPIKVISEVFITSVTSRPLSLEEIRERGIVLDQSNLQVINFQLAFNIEGQTFTIDLPVAYPTPDFLQFQSDRQAAIKQLAIINQALADRQIANLPPEFDRPGLNFSIAALPFVPAELQDEKALAFGPPPITGLIVIPGNIAFLNQFFSVLLMVTNVAPDGTPLVLRDVAANISLPLGLDRVQGTYEKPGDDPLRLARIQGIGQQPLVRVVQLGPDGKLSTADDIPLIPPQRTGEGEFLVEGLQEGSHTMDMEINAVLDGLPSGPVKLIGKAVGAVFVRNPTFSITLSHPRTVRSGESYNLYATVTNTSRSVANLVSVNLDSRSISGARLSSDETVLFDTIAAGQSATAKFTLVSQQTGDVTFSSFTSDPGLSGRIQLRTGVGERDIPLSPNAIVLPRTTEALPSSLVDAAQRVLGQALSIATAPPEALPSDVLYVKRQTVVDRGVELGEAGQRLQFGDPLPRVIQDLLLDWLGSRSSDDGFDQILRTTEAGAGFMAEVAKILNESVVSSTVLDYQKDFAQATVSRSSHLSAITGSGSGVAPVMLRIMDASGQVAGQGLEDLELSLPFGNLLNLQNGAGQADLALVARLNSTRYTVEVTGTADGAFDLGVVMPVGIPGQLAQLRYSGVSISRGGTARVVIDLMAPGASLLNVDRNGDGRIDGTVPPSLLNIIEQPPQVLTVRQLENSFFNTPGDVRDPATHGLMIGVLFDKSVTEASAEAKENYSLEANSVVGAQLQPSGRLVYLYLERPIGNLVARNLTLANIADERDSQLASTTRPIETGLSDGARVFGQVRTADGKPVANALMSLTIIFGQSGFTVATIRTDRLGSYDFEYVTRFGDGLVIVAQHPVTLQFTDLRAKIRAAGEMLLLNPTFIGRGIARGRVLGADGVTPVPGAPVWLIPSGFPRLQLVANANELGEYVIADVPVGTYTVRSIGGRGVFGKAAGLISAAGAEGIADIALINQPQDAGRLTGRVFLSNGSTPAAGFNIYVGTYDRKSSTISAVDQTTSDISGSFAFEMLLPGYYDVVAVDFATGQLGMSRISVLAQITNSVNIVMEAMGGVEGVVLNAQGRPVPGALIAGGISLGVADANGFFRIEGVPAGKRTIQAGDPLTKRRGSAAVTVFPGQTVTTAITLEARATIVGRVLDANGQPVPKATVRIPQSGGFTFVFANNSGFFRFPDLTLGEYLIQAPGPSQESLIAFMKFNGIDPCSAFTAGDSPPDLCGVQQPTASDLNAALAAYESALQTIFNASETRMAGLPPPPAGGFGFNKIKLFQDSVTVNADINYLSQGTVSGLTVDGNGLPTAALLRVSSLSLGDTGTPKFTELQRITTDPVKGEFSFGGIPRFDLATFQITGIRAGDFMLEAANPFSPVIAQFRGQLNVNNPNLAGIVLRFPPDGETNGTITGTVLMPDGVTPAPANTQVKISFGDLEVRTDSQGKFQNLFPIPENIYVLTAMEPISGFQGRAIVRVLAGSNVDVQIQLLGLGSVTVAVKRPNGEAVRNSKVILERAGFPGDRADGFTDANGSVKFVNITEGVFSVMAEEQGTGLKGRASGEVIKDHDVPVSVTITASGRVTGTFVRTDGLTPIPNAQIVLVAGNGVRAFAPTDNLGRFELLAIPVGKFVVEGSDPFTGRKGRGFGDLLFEGDVRDVTIIEVPRGTVQGFVLNNDKVTPIAGASISIAASSFVPTHLQATTRSDGSFRFDGVSIGDFTLTARDPASGFQGHATGTLTFEGEVANQNVLLDGFGSIHVKVLDTNGISADNVELTLTGVSILNARKAAVDTNGEFTFEFLPLGEYRIVARSLAEKHNGGIANITIQDANETADAIINLRGTGAVAVTVVESDGSTLVPSASVTLTAQDYHFGDTFLSFTNASGVTDPPISGVALGDFFVKAEMGSLAGLSTGRITSPEQNLAITVVLNPSGAIAGRVLLPDGVTPAAEAIVTLNFPSQSSLQSGVLQITTGLDGSFDFSGIPLGAFSITAIELKSSGVLKVSGTLTFDGQRIDLGNLILDNTAPRISAVSPADGTTGVPVNGDITITFSEPIQPGSVITNVQLPQANVLVLDGASRISGSLSFSDDHRTFTFTPDADLKSGMSYTLIVKGVPDGPKDAVNLQLLDPFVSSFTVQDIVPPSVVSTTPSSGEPRVLPEVVVRITFSEAIAPTLGMTLTAGAGQPVAGRMDLALGNTIVVFTPTDFLSANTTYTATLTGITDTAGNPFAGGDFAFQFSTVDTQAPVINALGFQGNPSLLAGTTIIVVPDLADGDVARVEYQFSNEAPRSIHSAPFTTSVFLPAGLPAIEVSAVAFDQAGNRSSPAVISIPITPNQPPTVTMTNLCGNVLVLQGQTCDFEVTATDDLALSRVFFSVVGAASQSNVIDVSGSQTNYSTRFTLTIPLTALPGSRITVQAAALDGSGKQSLPAVFDLQVRDGNPPKVVIISPANNAQVIPGHSADVTVTATDDVALTSVSLDCNPPLNGCVSRSVNSVSTSSQTFTVEISPTAAAPAIVTLVATATDTSGNIGQSAIRNLQIADTVKPTITSLQTVGGATQVPPGQVVAVEAKAADNVGVASVSFRVEAETTQTQTIPIAPPAPTTSSTYSFLVANTAVPGSTITIRAQARDGAGNISDEAVLLLQVGDTTPPTVRIDSPANGSAFNPGDTVTVEVSAEDNGTVSSLTLAAVGVTSLSETHPVIPPLHTASTTFQVVIPATATARDTLSLTAWAQDSFANSAQAEPVNLTIRDTKSPTVALVVKDGATQAIRGKSITITVSATDEMGVASLAFQAQGSFEVSEAKAIVPSMLSTSTDFVIAIPLNASLDIPLTILGTAKDEANNSGASASISLPVVAEGGTVRGTVFRSNGVTPVAGAQVTIDRSLPGSNTSVTDSQGNYSFELVPLGSFTLDVTDPATGDRGRATNQINALGEVRTVNINLNGFGTVVVTVQDAVNNTISGAQVTLTSLTIFGGTQSGTTQADGTVVFTSVLAGSFSVLATSGGISGSASGNVAVGGTTPITLQLQPVGVIQGTVRAVDGITPVPGATVRLSGLVARQSTTESDGSFRFEDLPLGTYSVEAVDTDGRIRARLVGIVLATNGDVATRDLIFIGEGSVSGIVSNPDGSPAPGIHVSVQSTNPAIGGFFSATTDSQGLYNVTAVPVGPFIATAANPALQLLGETIGQIDQDGQEVTANIQLLSNAITLPTNRYDANNALFDIQANGSILRGINYVYGGDYSSNQGGFLLDIIAAGTSTRFAGANVASAEQDRREIAINQQNVANLNVTRKIFIPRTGYFTRYLEILNNPTANPITVDIRILSNISSYIGSPGVIATSSGDAVLGISEAANPDRWVTIDDNTDGDPFLVSTAPALGFAFDGPNSSERVGAASFAVIDSSGSQLAYQWNSVTIPPGETTAYLHFGVQQTSRAAAQASAQRLIQLPPEALAGLSAEEIGQIRNFAVPADGVSAVAPLPSLNGTVNGRVLDPDNSTGVPLAAVRFKSNSLLFGRIRQFYSDANGSFRLAATFNDFGSSMPVPVDTFTLDATYPASGVQSPIANGSFPADQTEATQDIVFSNTGQVSGIVRRHTGVAVTTGGSVQILRNSPFLNIYTSIAGDGSYRFRGIPAGSYTLNAFVSSPQGTALTGANDVMVTNGETAAADITIEPTGALAGVVRTAGGIPAVNISVSLTRTGFDRFTQTNDSGQYLFSDVPVGSFTVSAIEPNTNAASTAQVTIIQDSTSTQDLTLVGVGTVQLQVNFANGNPAPNALVYIEESAEGNYFNFAGYTDSTGHLTIADVAVGAFVIRVYHPNNTNIYKDVNGTVAIGGETVTISIALPSIATVRVTVLMENNEPFVGAEILIETIPTGLFFAGHTDSNGMLEIPDIPEGAFSVHAYEPTYGTFAGSTTGTITSADDGQTVDVTITATSSGTVQGIVFAGDGQTPLPFISVEIFDASSNQLLASTYTDDFGFYSSLGITPGNQGFRVRAYSQSSASVFAERSGAFTAPGQTITLDLMIPVSVIKGTVFFSDGVTGVSNPSVFATQIDQNGNTNTFYATITDADGNYVITGVEIGDFSITAQDSESGLNATTAGTVTDVAIPVVINVLMPPSGTVTGTVYDANNNAVPYANVSVRSDALAFDRYSTADAQSVYMFNHVGLGPFTVQACDFVTNVCGSAAGTLAVDGETVSIDITLPAISSVYGTILAPDGTTPVAQAPIVIENSANSGPFGFFSRPTSADASGSYEETEIPVGTIRVTARDPVNYNLGGFAEGLLTSTGPARIDVTLGNAIGFPFDLDGADQFRYDVYCNGYLLDGGTTDRLLNDAYDASYLLVINSQLYPCMSTGSMKMSGRELIVGPASLGGLTVTRRIFVPSIGKFSRYLEIISNTTAAPITVPVEVRSFLGSGFNTRIVVSPSATNNTYAVTDQGGICCDPVLAHVFSGLTGLQPNAVQFETGNREIFYRWNITVPAGQTAIFMHFAIQRDILDAAGAQIQAEALVNFTDPNALAGMSAEEKAQVVNFNIP